MACGRLNKAARNDGLIVSKTGKQPLKHLPQTPHGYKVNQTHAMCLREGVLGHWPAGHAFERSNQDKSVLFNLNAHNTAANANEWGLAA